MKDKKDLQKEYEELHHKKPFAGWNEKELQERIDLFREDKPEQMKEEEFNIDPNKTYTFKMKEPFSSVVFFPMTMETWDGKRIRTIRCSATEESPYVDEQDEKATVDKTPIIINRGELIVQGTDSIRIKYILASDYIAGKEKTLPKNQNIAQTIELYDEGEVVREKLKRENDEFDARKLINTATHEEIRDYLRSVYLVNSDSMNEDELKVFAIEKVKKDASIWLKEFVNPKHKLKANIQRLFGKGELTDDNGEVRWKQGGGLIIRYDESKSRSDEALAKFAMLDSKESEDFKKTMAIKLA